MDVGSSQWGFRASKMSLCHHFIATLTPNYQNFGQQLCQCNYVRVHPYAYPRRMKVLWIGFHLSNIDVERSQWWSTASTMSSCHHFIATLTLNYQNLGQLCQCNSVSVGVYIAYVESDDLQVDVLPAGSLQVDVLLACRQLHPKVTFY